VPAVVVVTNVEAVVVPEVFIMGPDYPFPE
jgi:hypothetical protein